MNLTVCFVPCWYLNESHNIIAGFISETLLPINDSGHSYHYTAFTPGQGLLHAVVLPSENGPNRQQSSQGSLMFLFDTTTDPTKQKQISLRLYLCQTLGK